MGLTGTSGARTGSLVPRAQTPDADQRLWQEFQDAGRVSDPELWTKFNSMMKRPTTFESMLQLWDEMSQWDLLAAALVEIVDEATQTDSNSPGVLWYQCNDSKFEEELNEMLVKLDVENTIQSQVWYLSAMGNHFEKLEYAPGEGVMGMSFVHPMEMRRYWLERNRKCIGFRWLNHKPNKEDVFVQPDNKTPVERVSMASGQNTEELWYPWDFCFVGDTKISLLDGREVSLEQLQKEVGTGEFWVYSAMPDGRVVPGRAHSLKRTRQTTEIVEVELDNGEKIKCTPDHKFMLRDGTYKEAHLLLPDDSLMPLYRKLSTVEEHDRAGYELFFDNSAERWRFTHWLVAETAYGTHRGADGRLNERIASGEVQRFHNHKVVTVRQAGIADVYDFEVDGQHNFALSAGVFVHNCHFRRMFRMRVSEHGEPLFAEADGIYKKLRLAIDQMVVCRAQVQPDRYAVSIDVQEQPPIEQMKTVQRWRQTLRSKLAFGSAGQPNDLNGASDFSSYYNALALDTMIYIAQPKGHTNVISKLAGTADVPDVYDIELLTDLFYSIIGMPKSWFSGGAGSGGSGGGEAPSGRALLAQDIRFLRKIKSIRKPIVAQYQWLGYFHAVLKGKDVSQLEIKAMMPQIGSLEEQLKLEMLGIQADVLSKLGDVMEQYSLPKEAWIDTVFKRYMHLPDEVVSVFMTALPSEIDQGKDGKDESKKGAPSTRKLIEEIHRKIENTAGAGEAIKMLKEVIYKEKLSEPLKQRWSVERVLNKGRVNENDVVISSYGRHPFELKRKGVNESKGSEGEATAVIQRKVDASLGKKWDDDGANAPATPVTESAPTTGQLDAYRRWLD